MKTPPIPPSETERLAALRRYGVLDTPAEAAFDALTRLAAHLLKVPIALVSLVDADRQWFKARYGIDVTETPRDVSFCGHAVASERLLIVEDASADDRFADNPLVAGPTGIRFYAGQPLTTPDGHVLGTLCVIDRQPRKLDDEEREMLRLLAAQTMDQLARRRENRLLADREARLKAVLDTAVDVIVTIDERGVIERVNPAAEQMLGYTPEELTGQDVGVLASAPHGDRHAAYVRDYLRTGVSEVVGCSRQVSPWPVERPATDRRPLVTGPKTWAAGATLRPRQVGPSDFWGHRGGADAGTVSAGDCPFKTLVRGPVVVSVWAAKRE